LSLLFKAPPIGFCNHLIFFLLSVFYLHLLVGGGGGAAGRPDDCCKLEKLDEKAYLARLYESCVSGRETGSLGSFFERNIPAANSNYLFFLLPIPDPDNDVAIKRRNQQHGSA
jgi:hypothetical protein